MKHMKHMKNMKHMKHIVLNKLNSPRSQEHQAAFLEKLFIVRFTLYIHKNNNN